MAGDLIKETKMKSTLLFFLASLFIIILTSGCATVTAFRAKPDQEAGQRGQLKPQKQRTKSKIGRFGELDEQDTSSDRDVHYNSGVVYALQGKYDQAEKEYLSALRLDPTDADVHYNLSILYEDQLNDPGKAVGHYRRYLELKPDATDAEMVTSWLTAAKRKIKKEGQPVRKPDKNK